MDKYTEYKNIDYAEVASDVLKWWQENDIFKKSITTRAGKPTFTFYEGPPSANGTPGIHHVMARTVKDIFCRYKTQKGYQVARKGGWDTHGLPVELQVEKELNITKEDIGKKITVEAYNQKCKEAVMKYKSQWDDLTQKMGYWVDLDDPYITFNRDYMETLWNLLKKLYDKGLLYKGFTIQPYSPAAGTGLSSHELNQPGTYKDIKDTTIVAQFKVERNERSERFFSAADEQLYILAWTTTPWTLAANNSLAVGKNIKYVKVKTFNAYTHEPVSVILASDRVSTYFNAKAADLKLEDYNPGDKLIPFEVSDPFTGQELEGVDYEQLMPYIPLPKPAFSVLVGDFVTTEDGTGVVHLARTFGADDDRVSAQYGVPGIFVKDEDGFDSPIVDKQGKYVKEITDFAGMYVKNQYYAEGEVPEKGLDVQIAIKLKEENKAFKVEKYEHSYPHCWRTDKPVLYYPLDSWFVKTTAFKDRLVELNNTINWKPASTGTGRFGNWLENLVDWNLSRSRYWGTPLPIWRTEDQQEEICIGSLAELKAEVDKSVAAGFMEAELPEDFDLHRPYVDDVVLVSASGKKMFREKDLIDVWFDSGAMPYAQWHYPFENDEIFNNNYPADFIAEGVDQTRGWFFTLHAIAGMLFDKVAFKNVIANGLVQDKHGNKMSKSKGNAIDPFETLSKYGPDATRWYMISNANPWDNLKFDINGIGEVQRKFFGTLFHTYNFFALYANLDGFTFKEGAIQPADKTESDRWIISRLNSLILEVDKALAAYEPTQASRAIQDFVTDDLSNWYVRLNRKRFWVGAYNQDKVAAYQTLYTCMKVVAKLSAPIAPFYMERLYADLNAISGLEDSESVHLSDFPVADESQIDLELEKRMAVAQQASSLVHSLRKKKKIRVRQPLTKVMVPVLDQLAEERLRAVEDLILSETNVKKLEYIGEDSDVLVKKIKPNFRELGKRYGKKMKSITQAVGAFSQADIKKLEGEGKYDLEIDGEVLELHLDDFEISSEDIPGWLVATENSLTVALDITLTDELKKEGLSREFVNRVQNMRKDSGLEVQDKIEIAYATKDDFVIEALKANREYIQRETQALALDVVTEERGEQFEIDEFNLSVSLQVVK